VSTPAAVAPALDVEGFLTEEECVLLFHLARAVPRGCVVEIGSYRGRSTVALALGARAGAGAPVYAIEPHEHFEGPLGGTFGPADRRAFFENVLRTGVAEDVRLVNLPSETAAAGWTNEIGLLWIDGDHDVQAVRRDLASWQPHLAPTALVAFHDSTRPGDGPTVVVEEALAAGGFRPLGCCGRTTVLERVVVPGARP
jgi:hypothetical protein